MKLDFACPSNPGRKNLHRADNHFDTALTTKKSADDLEKLQNQGSAQVYVPISAQTLLRTIQLVAIPSQGL